MGSAVGTTILRFDGNPVYSPEFRTGGEAGTLVVTVTQVNDSPTLSVTPQVRRSKDTTFTDLTALGGVTAVGTHTLDMPSGGFGADWIMRLKFAFGMGADALDAVTLTYQVIPRPY